MVLETVSVTDLLQDVVRAFKLPVLVISVDKSLKWTGLSNAFSSWYERWCPKYGEKTLTGVALKTYKNVSITTYFWKLLDNKDLGHLDDILIDFYNSGILNYAPLVVWPMVFALLEETIVPALPKPNSLNPKKIEDFNANVVSLIHSSVVSLGTIWALYSNHQYFTDVIGFSNSFGSTVLMCSFGYFLGDLLRMIHADETYLSKNMRAFYLFHHTTSLCGLSFPIFTGRYQGLMLQILVAEVNTVITNIRSLLLNCDQTTSTGYTVVKYGNVATIVIVRVLQQARLLKIVYRMSQPFEITSCGFNECIMPFGCTSILCISILILVATIRSDFIIHGDLQNDLDQISCCPHTSDKTT